MYLEIENLTPEEAKTINTMFSGRVRLIDSIYTEICKIEADCTVDLLVDEGFIPHIPNNNKEVLSELSTAIACRCENTVFQELAEIADEVSRDEIENIAIFNE